MTTSDGRDGRLDAWGDVLPELAHSRCGTVRYLHRFGSGKSLGSLSSVSFSPDSRALVTAGDCSARVWDPVDGRELRVLEADEQPVMAARFVSPERVVTLSMDGAMRLWDVPRGAVLRCWRVPGSGGRRLALSPDGTTLLAATERPNGFVVFDVPTETLVKHVSLPDSPGAPAELSFSPDGSCVLMLEHGERLTRLSVFDAREWTPRWQVDGAVDGPYSWAVFSAEGDSIQCRYLETEREKNRVRTYAVRTGVLVEEVVRAHSPAPTWPLPDGRQMRIVNQRLVVSRGEQLERWLRLPCETAATRWRPGVSPDGRWVAFARDAACVLLVDLEAWRVVPEQAHHHLVTHLSFADDGRHLVTFCADGGLRVWEHDSGRQVRYVPQLPEYPHRMFLSAGRACVVMGFRERFLFDPLSEETTELSDGCDVYSAVWADDGSAFAQVHEEHGDAWLRVTDTRTGLRVGEVCERLGTRISAVSRGGRWLLVVNAWSVDDGTRRWTSKLWDVKRGTYRPVVIGRRQRARLLCLAPDEGVLVLQEDYRDVVLVDLSCPGREVRLGASVFTWAVALSADGSLVATGDIEGQVRVWGRDGALLATLHGHLAGIQALAFSRDGEWLASGSADATVLVWPRSAWRTQPSALSAVTMPSSSA
ncbi:WD40 repeat domain-containing protein [Myxococcus sp. K15C18031901]|uniref:WD40 repeat domain-containing protein n=1 Tax=Myxococcus dinghuensis TaxID=2906761 RepID=UPI0020A77F22|nr:WD40 repeat domain-containing protein [Myxococcus dinghuensis]MCP3098388.1 WD40 repeat domain-containing protein [Myxococcus dinghuensis]